jgi:3-methyladenine DNA glycosylase Mpg
MEILLSWESWIAFFIYFHCMDSVTELEGIDRGVLMRALRQLEQKGKAAIFKGTSADDEGVKFSV